MRLRKAFGVVKYEVLRLRKAFGVVNYEVWRLRKAFGVIKYEVWRLCRHPGEPKKRKNTRKIKGFGGVQGVFAGLAGLRWQIGSWEA